MQSETLCRQVGQGQGQGQGVAWLRLIAAIRSVPLLSSLNLHPSGTPRPNAPRPTAPRPAPPQPTRGSQPPSGMSPYDPRDPMGSRGMLVISALHLKLGKVSALSGPARPCAEGSNVTLYPTPARRVEGTRLVPFATIPSDTFEIP